MRERTATDSRAGLHDGINLRAIVTILALAAALVIPRGDGAATGSSISAAACTTDSTSINDSLPGPPPGTYRILSHDGSIRIPFRLWRGDILMDCRLNGRPVRMMIDNGFLWDQLLLFGSPAIDSLDLDYTGEADITGSEESGAIKSKYAEGITLTYDDVEFYGQAAVVTPYSSGASMMWEGTEGQVSATFFKNFAVRFDFDKMLMTLTPPEKFIPAENDVEIPIAHHFNNSWLVPAIIELQGGRRIEMDLMMDLGYGDWLQLSENGPHGIGIPERVVPASLGTGFQGETRGYFGRIKSLEIGGFVIDDLLTAFVPEAESGRESHESLLGLALLSNFNFTYDYPNRRMFVEPCKNFNTPSEHNMSGLEMKKGEGEYLDVKNVIPGSPADEKGIRPGDRVLSINGREATSYDRWDLRPLLRRDGSRVDLIISRDGKKREVSIVLRRLV